MICIHRCVYIYIYIYDIGKVVVSESIIIGIISSAIIIHQTMSEIVFRYTSHR